MKLNDNAIRQIVAETLVGRPWPTDKPRKNTTSKNSGMVTPVPQDLGNTLTSMM